MAGKESLLVLITKRSNQKGGGEEKATEFTNQRWGRRVTVLRKTYNGHDADKFQILPFSLQKWPGKSLDQG